jgi:hypothetical protein
MNDPASETVSRSTKVERCPVVQTNVLWPVPADQRLNELLDRLTDLNVGETSRSQLLSALVAAAPAERDELRTWFVSTATRQPAPSSCSRKGRSPSPTAAPAGGPRRPEADPAPVHPS